MYVKRGDVVACLYILYRVVPEERPSVRVLASAVDELCDVEVVHVLVLTIV